MRSMRKPALVGLLAAAAFGAVQTAATAGGEVRDYVVVYERGAATAEAREAIEAAGGRIVSENTKVGVATVRSDDERFAREAAAEEALVGAAPNEAIGRARPDWHAKDSIERPNLRGRGHDRPRRWDRDTPDAEPLGVLQWDMEMIHATPEESYRRQRGSHAVRVGIMDTGVDGSHPDIAPNFNAALSRNFTTDRPDVDGACADDPDGSCEDPGDVDENGHGTHVAGTVGAPLNDVGVGGVAPGVELVNLRAGQDSGYFFLQATVDALTYAGDNGIDVVNMSYYIDPWLFNCTDNPADSPEAQAEQRTIIEATQRALDYAHARDVTLVAAEGNGHTDLGHPEFDATSPDYPPDTNYPRQIDNSCLNLPTEGRNVIGVTSVGPTKRKAYYSDYGVEQADLSAPGGDAYDPTFAVYPVGNQILAPYPEAMALADIEAGFGDTILEHEGAYYAWLQGTSMASPHATGVAALAIAEHGKRDRRHGGLTLDPWKVERIMRKGAEDMACPEPRRFDYGDLNGDGVQDDAYDATCEGSARRNGFYGDGIVSATGVLKGKRRH